MLFAKFLTCEKSFYVHFLSFPHYFLAFCNVFWSSTDYLSFLRLLFLFSSSSLAPGYISGNCFRSSQVCGKKDERLFVPFSL
jgi:hypothetical protein